MHLLDTQKYSECQLVAIINAATFLGQPQVDPDSEEYERLVDLTASRYGSAVFPHKAVEYLRLIKTDIRPVEVEAVRRKVREGAPVQVTIQHPDLGLHATLLTGGNHRSVQAWNVKGLPNDRMSWERLRELMGAVAPQCRSAMWYALDPIKVNGAQETCGTG